MVHNCFVCEPWCSWLDFATGCQRVAFDISWIVITIIRWHLTFHNCYVTFQPQFSTSKCCARWQMSPLPPWLRHCIQDRIMFASSYAYSQISWSWSKLQNSHTDIHFKTKTVISHAAKCWTRCRIFRNVEIEMFNPVPYFSKHSVQSPAGLLVAATNAPKHQLLQVCRWCWVFAKLTWNLSTRSKATWDKSFLMLLA